MALEAGSTGTWQFDIDTQKSFWGRRTREIFGLETGEEALAREASHALPHPDDKERNEQVHALPGCIIGQLQTLGGGVMFGYSH